MEGTNKHRSPTEAELKYACGEGSQGSYTFCNEDSNLREYAWYPGKQTHPVGQKKPNAWGLHDMHNNVWEWCQDRYEIYPSGSVSDPTIGLSSGYYRVIRGGSSFDSAKECQPANRDTSHMDGKGNYQGFCLVRTP